MPSYRAKRRGITQNKGLHIIFAAGLRSTAPVPADLALLVVPDLVVCMLVDSLDLKVFS